MLRAYFRVAFQTFWEIAILSRKLYLANFIVVLRILFEFWCVVFVEVVVGLG